MRVQVNPRVGRANEAAAQADVFHLAGSFAVRVQIFGERVGGDGKTYFAALGSM